MESNSLGSLESSKSWLKTGRHYHLPSWVFPLKKRFVTPRPCKSHMGVDCLGIMDHLFMKSDRRYHQTEVLLRILSSDDKFRWSQNLQSCFICSWKELMTAYYNWGDRRLRSQIWWALFPWTWLPSVNFWRRWRRKLTLMGLMDQACWVLELNILTSRVGKSYRYNILQFITTRLTVKTLLIQVRYIVNLPVLIKSLQCIKSARTGRDTPYISNLFQVRKIGLCCFCMCW